MHSMPERKPSGDDQSDQHTDQKEQAIGGEHDQQNRDHHDGDNKARRSLQTEPRAGGRIRLHEVILTPLLHLGVIPSYCLAVGISAAGGVAIGAMLSASDGISGSGPSRATASTWSMLSTKCSFIAVRRFSGTSATSFSFSCGRITSNKPARWAASTSPSA